MGLLSIRVGVRFGAVCGSEKIIYGEARRESGTALPPSPQPHTEHCRLEEGAGTEGPEPGAQGQLSAGSPGGPPPHPPAPRGTVAGAPRQHEEVSHPEAS